MLSNATFNNISAKSRWSVLEPPTCHKSLTKCILYCCKEYISPSAGIEFTTLVVIGTDGKGSCLSKKHTTIMSLQTDDIALINMQYVAAFALKRAKVPLTVNIVIYLKSFGIGCENIWN